MFEQVESEPRTRGLLCLGDPAGVDREELVLACRASGPRPVTRAPRRQNVALASSDPRQIRFEILVAAEGNALAQFLVPDPSAQTVLASEGRAFGSTEEFPESEALVRRRMVTHGIPAAA